jgi:hypothetical protein
MNPKLEFIKEKHTLGFIETENWLKWMIMRSHNKMWDFFYMLITFIW